MNLKETASYALKCLKKELDSSSVEVKKLHKKEFIMESGRLNLLKTSSHSSLSLTGLSGHKKGSININKITPEAIEEAVSQVKTFAASSREDSANEIPPFQENKEFSTGPEDAEKEKMYTALKEFKESCNREFPSVVPSVSLTYSRSENYYLNSNGTSFISHKGAYILSGSFLATEGLKVSSLNTYSLHLSDLDTPLIEQASIRRKLKDTVNQLNTSPLPGKFTGEIILTPSAVSYYMNLLAGIISDSALISGKSPLKHMLNQRIGSPLLTLKSCPRSEEVTSTYFTAGGFEAEDTTIIDKGILKEFILGLYASNKTGHKRSLNSGGCFVIPPGNNNLMDIIGTVKKGILLDRFSGGTPTGNGDFSGVAKNSYYIEDGKIQHPLSETMISGNIKDILVNMKALSKETENTGHYSFPWIQTSGITISGK